MEEQVHINSYKRAVDNISRDTIIRFQLMMHCYFSGIRITDDNLKILTLLAIEGRYELKEFVDLIVKKKLSGSTEGIRTVLRDIQRKGLIIKEGGYRKVIRLHPDMKIQTEGNVMVDIKLLSRGQVSE